MKTGDNETPPAEQLEDGMSVLPGLLDGTAQEALVAALQEVATAAPFFTPRMPRTAKPFSVAMTNCGQLGWVSDVDGYRYQPTHPETGRPWPAMPAMVLELWQRFAGYPHPPEACLVNYYRPGARMGLHQDRDEEDFDAPVLSVSLGDTCVFRVGGTRRTDPTRSVRLASGDVVVLGGPSRLAFHGVDRLIADSSRLLRDWLPEGGRVNLTVRRVRRLQVTPP
jgi:DNA oxidative demethylase